MAIAKKKIKAIGDSVIPWGMIATFWLSAAPEGWVICDGRQYTDRYGNTQTAPNLIGLYPLFSNSSIGAGVEAGLPNITGGAMHQENGQQSYGAFFDRTGGSGNGLGANDWRSGYNHGFGFDASRSNPIYGRSNTVTPPSVRLLVCMKI